MKNEKSLEQRILEDIDIRAAASWILEEDNPRKWLCPFHDDHHPGSFKVFSANNRFKCFSCGAFGNSIDLVQQVRQCEREEAVALLAKHFFHEAAKPVQHKEMRKEMTCAPLSVRHVVYDIFRHGMSLAGKKEKKLNDKHHQYLLDRGISEAEIERYGYFSMPDRSVLPFLCKALHQAGLDESILVEVPGFYRWKNNGKIDMSVTQGIGIPMHTTEGKIAGIQIRRDVLQSELDSRYVWFSSSWINENNKAKQLLDGGATPGSPIDVIRKKDENRVIVTEGHFKAMRAAEHYGCTALSLQGIGAGNGISAVLKELKKVKTVILAFDGDLVFNENVFLQEKKLYERLKEDYVIKALTWDVREGKGIDDVLNNHGSVYLVPFARFKEAMELFYQEKAILQCKVMRNEEEVILFKNTVGKKLWQKKYQI